MKVRSYLEKREGKAFPLQKVLVHLEDHSEVSALVPLYNGPNVIEGKTIEELATMVLAASGASGTCLSYVNGIADKLSTLGIDDPAVSALLNAVNNHA
jgi:cation transport protein ChaC